jgi:hypothetical protein
MKHISLCDESTDLNKGLFAQTEKDFKKRARVSFKSVELFLFTVSSETQFLFATRYKYL